MLNDMSNFGAGFLDTTETFCDMVGFAEMGVGITKFFKGKGFKLLNDKGSLNFSGLKDSAKSGIVNLKDNIKQGYKNVKNGITGNVPKGVDDLKVLDNVDELKDLNKVDDFARSGTGALESGSETVTYRRVQGGQGTQSSQKRVVIDNDGNVYINKTDKNLNVSIDNGEHSQHFLKNRPDADIYEFEVPKWFDDMVQENTIPQAGYKSNRLNQGGTAPKLTDPTTPGKSIEFPAPWVEWMEEYATNGRIIKGGQ